MKESLLWKLLNALCCCCCLQISPSTSTDAVVPSKSPLTNIKQHTPRNQEEKPKRVEDKEKKRVRDRYKAKYKTD